MTDLETRAYTFALAAHTAIGQKRKYTGEPYIIHPMEVAATVKTVPGHTEEMVAAAYLHDVVEDTDVGIDVILHLFGATVAEYVRLLTDPPKVEGGPNRKERKRHDRERLSGAPSEVQTIKLADLIANTTSIVQFDPKFAVTYLEEKRLLLEVMDKGDAELHARATAIVQRNTVDK